MEMAPNNAIVLPIVTIQPTFHEVIDEVDTGLIPSDDFWVSCYKTDSPSVHTKVTAALDEADRNLVNLASSSNDVKMDAIAKEKYTISCKSLGISSAKVTLPMQVYADPDRSNPQHPHRITAFDVAPDGSQFATGYLDGTVHLYPIVPPTKSKTPVGSGNRKVAKAAHLSTITSLRFFPSSRVLLSAGADFSLSILPAELEPNPTGSTAFSSVRNLKGHRRMITDTAIISRGRNILSSSQDGTIRLWDVSEGGQISMLIAGRGQHTPVNALSIGVRGDTDFAINRPDGENASGDNSEVAGTDSREVETSDKIVFCALKNGSFEVFDLRIKSSVYLSSKPNRDKAGLTSIAYHPSHNLLATGSADGLISLYDTRNMSTNHEGHEEVLTSFTRNGASIEGIRFSSGHGDRHEEEVGLAVATEDGLPYLIGVAPAGPVVSTELVGSDCDAVRSLRIMNGGKEIWTAGDDSIVRRYEVW